MGFVLWVCASTASGGVVNPGFETGDLTGWLTFGQGWRTGVGADAYTGEFGLVNDVLTNDADNFRGVFQSVPVIEGERYSAGVYIRAVNIESSESWFELQWLDSGGGIIDQLQSAHVAADQPFTLMAMDDAIAPAGAVTASVRGIVFMPTPPPEDADFHIFDDFFLLSSSDLTLYIRDVTTNEVELSWSTNAAGFLLQNITNLTEGEWSDLPGPASVSDGRFVVTNPASPFWLNFRLRNP